MYKSGFLGGRPQGGVPPRKRYEDMDWVRGRAPDALLFLKALVKAAPSGLSVWRPPLTPTELGSDRRVKLSRSNLESSSSEVSAATANVSSEEDDSDAAATAAAGVVGMATVAGGGLGSMEGGQGTTARQSSSCYCSSSSSSSSSTSATGKKLALADDASPACAAVVSEGASGVGGPSIMEGVVEALTPRTLAERALLAPLRDVGTMAGALRS
ncbi:unnamed protein product, partial [Ectocarpus sp. 12 AP-2014]